MIKLIVCVFILMSFSTITYSYEFNSDSNNRIKAIEKRNKDYRVRKEAQRRKDLEIRNRKVRKVRNDSDSERRRKASVEFYRQKDIEVYRQDKRKYGNNKNVCLYNPIKGITECGVK